MVLEFSLGRLSCPEPVSSPSSSELCQLILCGEASWVQPVTWGSATRETARAGFSHKVECTTEVFWILAELIRSVCAFISLDACFSSIQASLFLSWESGLCICETGEADLGIGSMASMKNCRGSGWQEKGQLVPHPPHHALTASGGGQRPLPGRDSSFQVTSSAFLEQQRLLKNKNPIYHVELVHHIVLSVLIKFCLKDGID